MRTSHCKTNTSSQETVFAMFARLLTKMLLAKHSVLYLSCFRRTEYHMFFTVLFLKLYGAKI